MIRSGMQSRSKQRGFSLIDVGIAVAIMVAITISGMWIKVEEARQANAIRQGKAMATLATNLQNYIIINHRALLAGTPIAGFVNSMAPTMAELTATGFVTLGTNNYYGGTYVTSIRLVPLGCVAAACDIEGIIATTTRITHNGVGVSEKLAGYAAREIGPDGGYSTSLAAGNISGLNGNWVFPNPNGAVSGILAARTSYGSSSLSYFLPRDGSLPMTGDLDMGTNNIVNGNDISIAGRLGTNGLSATTGYPAGWTGGVHTRDVYAEGRIGTGAGGTLQTVLDSAGNIWASQTITAGQNLSAGNDIWLGSRGTWLSAVFDRMPNYSFKGGFMVGHGSVVSKPACAAGGSARIIVTPQNIYLNPATNMASWFATDNGVSWTISMVTWGAPPSGGATPSGSAIVQTYCFYTGP